MPETRGSFAFPSPAGGVRAAGGTKGWVWVLSKDAGKVLTSNMKRQSAWGIRLYGKFKRRKWREAEFNRRAVILNFCKNLNITTGKTFIRMDVKRVLIMLLSSYSPYSQTSIWKSNFYAEVGKSSEYIFMKYMRWKRVPNTCQALVNLAKVLTVVHSVMIVLDDCYYTFNSYSPLNYFPGSIKQAAYYYDKCIYLIIDVLSSKSFPVYSKKNNWLNAASFPLLFCCS